MKFLNFFSQKKSGFGMKILFQRLRNEISYENLGFFFSKTVIFWCDIFGVFFENFSAPTLMFDIRKKFDLGYENFNILRSGE